MFAASWSAIGAEEGSVDAVSVDRMAVNGRILPLGIAPDDISFGWTLRSAERGIVQSAYHIRLGTTEGGSDVWDSGRVVSDRQIDVRLPKSLSLAPATRFYWQVNVSDGDGNESQWSDSTWFETGLLSERDWSGASWIARPVEQSGSLVDGTSKATSSLPLLRGGFIAKSEVTSARLYATAHGIYELSVNGQKAGDQYLAPGWTDYPKRLQHQTYDITTLVKKGSNEIGAALADGWYRGNVGMHWAEVYGDRLSLIAKIKLTYADGTIEWFGTGRDWEAGDGPFVCADLQDGECYDASHGEPDWKLVEVLDLDSTCIVPQPDEPVRVLATLTARERTEPTAGYYVYDLGQNMVGVAQVVMNGRKGQTVTIRYAEELYRTGDRKGQLYTDNFRLAKVTDTYTFGEDGSATYRPIFTQHGFRYVELTGLEEPPSTNDVKGIVLGSDLPDTGDLVTSNPMLNRLVSNIRWGQRGNFLSIPTDTPARDERLGWTGDISVFSSAACRFRDCRAFLSKWMDDMRDVQKEDGNIPAVVPQPRNEFDQTGVGWSDAFITVPYAVWHATGDERILRDNWEAMKRFYDFVYASATNDGNLLEEGRSSWFSGDWLSLENNWDRLEEHKVIATAYFAEDTRMMAEMAAVMGETQQAAIWTALIPEIRKAFVDAYRAADGTIYQGTQAAYAIALGMNMIADPEQRALTGARFVEQLVADNNHLKTGFLGTPRLLPALGNIGRTDLAMKLLQNEDYPSWGFPISMGATTMWERWNSISPDGTFGDVSMNSFNHYAYGAVGDWMFANLGGIQLLEPGYKKSRIVPLIGAGGLTHAACSQETAYGRIATEWSVSDAGTVLQIEIPVNTTAEVVIPASASAIITEGEVATDQAPGVKFLEKIDGATIYSVGSGHYVFRWAD
ncbi:MAG: family 78 glycoside hydrolase catalytic domain [Pontiellaceae bacterium]|nr:family 78 glycoside hydrolase catalytic domain [Pontiellaceae bacterium]